MRNSAEGVPGRGYHVTAWMAVSGALVGLVIATTAPGAAPAVPPAATVVVVERGIETAAPDIQAYLERLSLDPTDVAAYEGLARACSRRGHAGCADLAERAGDRAARLTRSWSRPDGGAPGSG